MDIALIRDEADHRKALERINAIFDAEPGTPEYAELDLLATLVDAYENEHYPLSEAAAEEPPVNDLKTSRRDIVPTA